MADMTDADHDQEICSLKSELHECERVRAALELQLQQKEENLDVVKLRDEKLLDQINKLTTETDAFQQIMEEYENTITKQLAELDSLKQEHNTVKLHLASSELSFSDVFHKYERCKSIIMGYKSNEEVLEHNLLLATETIKKNEEKYESLKAHARAQIDKCNKEILLEREKHQVEMNKVMATLKWLEIKNSSLTNALEQKTRECGQLTALCEEVTGRVE